MISAHSLLVISFAAIALAQPATDPVVTAAAEETARLAAQTALVNAQKTLLDAQKALKAAQTGNPATEETARLTAETALLNARKAAAAALVPNLSTVPNNAGDTTVSGSTPVESVAMAYQSLDRIAAKIATAIACGSNTVVLFAPADLNGLDTLRAWQRQVAMAKARLEEAITANNNVPDTSSVPAAGIASIGLLGAIGPALEAINKIAGLFRVDTTYNYADVTVDQNALAALLAPKLGPTCNVYFPTVMPPGVGAGDTVVETALTELRTLRLNLAKLNVFRAADKVAAEAKLKAATTDNDKAIWQSQIATVAGLIKSFEAGIALVDTIEAALLRAEESSGLSQLLRLRRSALFAEILKGDGWGVKLDVQKLAGNTRTRKNWLLGTRLSFAGGAVASFHAYEYKAGVFTGKLVKSGHFDEYSPYRRQGQPRAN